jgi:hypothetical protein
MGMLRLWVMLGMQTHRDYGERHLPSATSGA